MIVQKMGSIKDLSIAKMPGMSDMMPYGVDIDDKEFVRIEAIIQSFTKFERKDPYALVKEESPRASPASPRATWPARRPQVTELVQSFSSWKQMMGGLGQNMGDDGPHPRREERRHGQAAARKMLAQQGGGMPGMGMPGMELPGDARDEECPG